MARLNDNIAQQINSFVLCKILNRFSQIFGFHYSPQSNWALILPLWFLLFIPPTYSISSKNFSFLQTSLQLLTAMPLLLKPLLFKNNCSNQFTIISHVYKHHKIDITINAGTTNNSIWVILFYLIPATLCFLDPPNFTSALQDLFASLTALKMLYIISTYIEDSRISTQSSM